MRGQEGRLYYAAVLWCDVMLAIPRHSVLIVGAVSICLTYSPYYVLVWERNRPPPPFSRSDYSAHKSAHTFWFVSVLGTWT